MALNERLAELEAGANEFKPTIRAAEEIRCHINGVSGEPSIRRLLKDTPGLSREDPS
jgi:hypothetical protein